MPGDYVGFSVQGITVQELQRGFVCSDTNNDPADEVTCFTAYV
jgi:translation elongation factor EF-1alpha